VGDRGLGRSPSLPSYVLGERRAGGRGQAGWGTQAAKLWVGWPGCQPPGEPSGPRESPVAPQRAQHTPEAGQELPAHPKTQPSPGWDRAVTQPRGTREEGQGQAGWREDHSKRCPPPSLCPINGGAPTLNSAPTMAPRSPQAGRAVPARQGWHRPHGFLESPVSHPRPPAQPFSCLPSPLAASRSPGTPRRGQDRAPSLTGRGFPSPGGPCCSPPEGWMLLPTPPSLVPLDPGSRTPGSALASPPKAPSRGRLGPRGGGCFQVGPCPCPHTRTH